jgi:hypothetical protein
MRYQLSEVEQLLEVTQKTQATDKPSLGEMQHVNSNKAGDTHQLASQLRVVFFEGPRL